MLPPTNAKMRYKSTSFVKSSPVLYKIKSKDFMTTTTICVTKVQCVAARPVQYTVCSTQQQTISSHFPHFTDGALFLLTRAYTTLHTSTLPALSERCI